MVFNCFYIVHLQKISFQRTNYIYFRLKMQYLIPYPLATPNVVTITQLQWVYLLKVLREYRAYNNVVFSNPPIRTYFP